MPRMSHCLQSKSMHCFVPLVCEKTRKDRETDYIAPKDDESYLSDFYLWAKFVKFIRWASGPYSRQRKVAANESLAIREILLFGSRPPARKVFSPLRENDRTAEFRTSPQRPPE